MAHCPTEGQYRGAGEVDTGIAEEVGMVVVVWHWNEKR